MSPQSLFTIGAPMGFPRSRGDEPCPSMNLGPGERFSPLTRG
ncbi:hypothetical protein HMPREF1978_01868 [Actinomyces graevenitzii F0530]|uniref:Uncharacterized protein n=1 Tax=Actinomyces graevenitzii F0530 TaxID=1321817 RepID=U1PC29_9ACTO|nr:hypothetical protein HMPREF1978_01868 [Actinomyces graevenitzii F0530]